MCRALLDWAFDPHAVEADPRVLLLTSPSGEVIGVSAHEHAALVAPGGKRIEATKMQVLALSLP